MPQRLPRTAIALGLAALVPFVLCAIGALSASDGRAAGWIAALLGYGAVTLSLLGGVHWGLVLGAAEPGPRDQLRLALGVLPALIGWAALLVTLVVRAEFGLGVLTAGFAATVLTEARLKRDGLVPSGYLWLRWGQSLVVVAILVTVLTMRLLRSIWPGVGRSVAYYKKVLQPDETVKFVGKLHWIVYRHAILLAILAAIATVMSSEMQGFGPILTTILLLLAALTFLSAWFIRVTTEIVVTSKRVIHKVGWISRQTEEMNITKVETVDVDQSLTGRLLGFGDVSIRGIGGSWEPLRWIGKPLDLRNAVIVG